MTDLEKEIDIYGRPMFMDLKPKESLAADESTGGIAISFVDECVNYDLPENAEKFEQRWGRFLRISRTSDFDMVLLQDTSKSLAWDEIILRLLEKSGWIFVV